MVNIPLKMDCWNTNFLLGPGLFSGAFAVSFQGCNFHSKSKVSLSEMNVPRMNISPKNNTLNKSTRKIYMLLVERKQRLTTSFHTAKKGHMYQTNPEPGYQYPSGHLTAHSKCSVEC